MDEALYQKSVEDKIRAFANLIIDRILDDYKNDRLNYVIKRNTIIIGNNKYVLKVIVPITLIVTVKEKLVWK